MLELLTNTLNWWAYKFQMWTGTFELCEKYPTYGICKEDPSEVALTFSRMKPAGMSILVVI